MAKRIRNRMELREQFDAAERQQEPEAEAEETEEVEEEDDEEEEEGEAAAAEEEDADEEEGEGDDDDEDAPKKKKKKKVKKVVVVVVKPPPKAKSRARTPKVVRMKVVWGVFNNSNQRVAVYDYPRRKDADEHATRLTTDKKQTHFVQPVKEPVEEKKE